MVASESIPKRKFWQLLTEWNPQRLYAELHALTKHEDDIVRPIWRHIERGRNDLARFKRFSVASLERVTNVDGPKVVPSLPAYVVMHRAILGCMREPPESLAYVSLAAC